MLEYVPADVRQIAVMVGDREHDVFGARQNNIRSIAVGYGYGTPEELKAAAPTHLVSTVEELAELLQHRSL